MVRFKRYYLVTILGLIMLIPSAVACNEDNPRELAAISIATEGLPVINSFYADPDSYGGAYDVRLYWDVSDASDVTIDHGIGNVSFSGDISVSSIMSSNCEDTTFTLTATNEVGRIARTTVVYCGHLVGVFEPTIPEPPDLVAKDPGIKPTEEPTSPNLVAKDPGIKQTEEQSQKVEMYLPIIHSFKADPESIVPGSPTKLSWDVSNADTITITGLGFSHKDPSLTGSVITSPKETTKYILQAINSKGSVSQGVTVTVADTKTTTPSSNLQQELASKLKGDVVTFQLVKLDMGTLTKSLYGDQSVTIPVTGAGAKEVTMVNALSDSVLLRDPKLSVVLGKISKPGEKPTTTNIKLPPERNFRIMMNYPAQDKGVPWLYGGLTILDDEGTMVSGMIMDSNLGISFIEPVDIIMGKRENPGLHVVYNIKDTVMFDCPEDTEETIIGQFKPIDVSLIPNPQFYTNIVLDGDQQFYAIDPSTVWSRMESVFNNVDIIYSIIEPQSLDWGLHLTIKGMEVWVSGGPTTTNKNSLSNELADPSYFLINPVEKDEIHFFFVGYDVSSVYGRACGIGNSGSDWFGGGEGLNHAYAEAMASQSLKAQWVVMAHEIGHLIGGRHEDGVVSGECAGGFLNSLICAPSLMPAGSAGAPEGRSPFFSNANDANIIATLYAVLTPP